MKPKHSKNCIQLNGFTNLVYNIVLRNYIMNLFTPEEFEIEFYQRMSEWIQGEKKGVDPRENWENYALGKWGSCIGTPSFASNGYRWKPTKKRTVTIDGVELVAPEITTPDEGTLCHLTSGDGSLFSLVWETRKTDLRFLLDGRIYLTPENAQAMYKAQRKQRLGGAA
jgi:hypothetical protein